MYPICNRQQGDRPSPIPVANERSKGLTALDGQLIHADDVELISLINSTASECPQQCVVVDRHHQTIGEGGRWPAAECQTEVMDDCLKPLGAAAIASQPILAEPFAENAPTANDHIAPKPPRDDREFCSLAAEWQISGAEQISALNLRVRHPQSGQVPEDWGIEAEFERNSLQASFYLPKGREVPETR